MKPVVSALNAWSWYVTSFLESFTPFLVCRAVADEI